MVLKRLLYIVKHCRVNTDTCDRGASHWVAFHFPHVGSAEFVDSLGSERKRITAVSPTPTDRNTTTVRLKSNLTTPTPALPVLH
jgi:hypothetical protein